MLPSTAGCLQDASGSLAAKGGQQQAGSGILWSIAGGGEALVSVLEGGVTPSGWQAFKALL